MQYAYVMFGTFIGLALIITAIIIWPKGKELTEEEKENLHTIELYKKSLFNDRTYNNYDFFKFTNEEKRKISTLDRLKNGGYLDEDLYQEQLGGVVARLDENEKTSTNKTRRSMHKRRN